MWNRFGEIWLLQELRFSQRGWWRRNILHVTPWQLVNTTFQKDSKAFAFKIEQPKDNSLFFLGCLTLKVSAICSFETSISTYTPTRSNIPGNLAMPTLTGRLCLSANNSEFCLAYGLFMSCQQCLWRHSSFLYRASLPTSPHSSLEHFLY